MPTVRVHTGGWEHGCCGPEFERYARVSVSCVRGDPETLVVSRHHEHGDPVIAVSGTIVDLLAVDAQGAEHAIDRVPSGRALSGGDPNDDAIARDPFTDEIVDLAEQAFVLVIDGHLTEQ